jgi:DNA-binding CsgD family transcriptional regulator
MVLTSGDLVALAGQSAKNSRALLRDDAAEERAAGPALPVRQDQHRLQEEEIAQLVAARLDGAQIQELARLFRVNRSTVEEHLRRQAVPKRRYSGRTMAPDQLLEAGQLYQSGLSLVGVGERLGVDKRYLAKALPAAGFVIRRPGRRARV